MKIPTEAIVDGRRVFVHQAADKKVYEKQVQTGLTNWAFTEILSGLEESRPVVINVDKPGLKDGVTAVVAEAAP